MATEAICIICQIENYDYGPKMLLQKRGADGINSSSKERENNVVAAEGSTVHAKCRMRFTDEKDINLKQKSAELLESSKNRKSSRLSISSDDSDKNSNLNCLFCGNIVNRGPPRDGRKSDASEVRTDEFVKTIKKCCEERGDEWSYNVSGKIEYFSSDLHAADSVYHRPCSVNFRTGKQVNKYLYYIILHYIIFILYKCLFHCNDLSITNQSMIGFLFLIVPLNTF